MSRSQPDLQQTQLGVILRVKVVPGATRSRVVGVLDGALKVAVSAPAEKGKANKALIKLLADVVGVPRNRITVQQGHTSPHKLLLFEGLAREDLLAKLVVD